MTPKFHKQLRKLFVFIPFWLLIGSLAPTLPGCFPTSNLYVQEYDEVYATYEDIEAEEARRAQIELMPADSVNALKPPPRITPEQWRKIGWTTSYVLEALISVAGYVIWFY